MGRSKVSATAPCRSSRRSFIPRRHPGLTTRTCSSRGSSRRWANGRWALGARRWKQNEDERELRWRLSAQRLSPIAQRLLTMSLPLEIALRYLRSRPSRLVSSVSLLSIAGIGLGVAALVVAMGLLSGYRREIREKLIGANAEVVVFSLSGGFPDPAAVEKRIRGVSRVRAPATVIDQADVAAAAATPHGGDAD